MEEIRKEFKKRYMICDYLTASDFLAHTHLNQCHIFASSDALLVTLKKSLIFSLTIPGKLQSYLACGKPIMGQLMDNPRYNK